MTTTVKGITKIISLALCLAWWFNIFMNLRKWRLFVVVLVVIRLAKMLLKTYFWGMPAMKYSASIEASNMGLLGCYAKNWENKPTLQTIISLNYC
jgi:hypothetical protein